MSNHVIHLLIFIKHYQINFIKIFIEIKMMGTKFFNTQIFLPSITFAGKCDIKNMKNLLFFFQKVYVFCLLFFFCTLYLKFSVYFRLLLNFPCIYHFSQSIFLLQLHGFGYNKYTKSLTSRMYRVLQVIVDFWWIIDNIQNK